MVSVHPARSEMVFPEGVLSFWQSLLVFQVPISLLTRAVLQSLSRGTSVWLPLLAAGAVPSHSGAGKPADATGSLQMEL